MSAPPPQPAPIFTLSIYEEGDQLKSIHCFRDPACTDHRAAVLLLLRRALFALDHADNPPVRCSPERRRFPKT